jgi:hypothetical protein
MTFVNYTYRDTPIDLDFPAHALANGLQLLTRISCDYCGRELSGESKEDSVLQALKHGWKIRLQCFAPEKEIIGLADLIRAVDSNDCLCPRCLKLEFEI